MSSKERIAGIGDLLISSLNLENPERAADACENILLPITAGIQAIGKLMVNAVDSDSGLETDALRDTGYLLDFLADLQLSMHNMLVNANYDLRKPG